MPRRDFRDRAVIVTGAARGLGKALCRRFGTAGARVGGVDVLAEELVSTRDELRAAGLVMESAVCDLTDESATGFAFGELRERLGPIDVLINNAGVTHIRRFDAGEARAVRKVMAVNFEGCVNATAAAFDDLVARRGQVIAISSVAGYSPLVARTGYTASKHAVHGFFGSLRAEVHGTGVGVLLACPSFIATELHDRSAPDAGPIGGEASPESVADKIFAAAEHDRRLLVVGRIGRLAYWVHRFAPRLYEILMRRSVR